MQGLYDAVKARLAARCPALLQVETGMAPEPALGMMALGPDVSALVSPLSDAADPVPEAAFIVSQRTVERFGVCLGLVFPGGFAQFEPARDQVKAALRGWMPDGAATAIQYAGGRTLLYQAQQDGRWLHLLTFLVTFRETIEAQS